MNCLSQYGPLPRRASRTVRIGHVTLGGASPIVVQSMTNTDTADIQGTIAQIASLARAGSELVRITVDRDEAAKAVPHIRDPERERRAFPRGVEALLPQPGPGGREVFLRRPAALQHLQLPPEVLFHEEGYKGGASSLIENFSAGRYIGVPMLQWLGLTKEAKNDAEADEFTYPKMKNWLRSNSN
mgnify:CR=1 FL=1